MQVNPSLNSAGVHRARMLGVLAAGPWRWPLDQSFDGTLQRPALGAGVVPLVTVRGSKSELWRLAVGGVVQLPSAPFRGDALTAWLNARAALSRHLPVLWRPLATIPDAPVPGLLLGVACEHGDLHSSPTLEGTSFGGSFLLAMASLLLGIPADERTIASVVIDAVGNAGPVNGLRTKVRGLLALAPSIRVMLVHHDQVPEAEQHRTEVGAGPETLKFIGVGSATDVLSNGFDKRLQELLVDVPPDAVPAMVASLFALARRGDRKILSWGPVEAAVRAISASDHLNDEARRRLAFVSMTAGRHRANAVAAEEDIAAINDDSWLASLQVQERLDVVAGLLQQHVDTGSPSAARCEALYRMHIRPVSESFGGHHKLRGAYGRVLATHGDFDGALYVQIEAARGWLDAGIPQEASHPLSEWFRLAPLASNPGVALLAAEQFLESATEAGFVVNDFISLYRARGRRRLNHRPTDARAALQSLADDVRALGFLRLAAQRELAAAGSDAARTAIGADTSDDGPTYRALVGLDDAIRDGDDNAARVHLDALRAISETARILAAMDERRLTAAEIAAEFPY